MADSYSAVHTIYERSLRCAKPALWPPRPHCNGPCPIMTARTQLAIGVAVVAEAGRRFPPDDPAAFAKLHALAKRVSDGAKVPRERLDDAGKPSTKDAITIKVAKLAGVRAAANFLYSPETQRGACGVAVTNGSAWLARSLAARSGEDVTSYLAWLDHEIMRQDLTALLAEKSLGLTSPIATVVSRQRNAKATLALSIARLANGSLGLYAKLKTKWEWHEGDKATIFATVPDAYMDAALRDLEAA